MPEVFYAYCFTTSHAAAHVTMPSRYTLSAAYHRAIPRLRVRYGCSSLFCHEAYADAVARRCLIHAQTCHRHAQRLLRAQRRGMLQYVEARSQAAERWSARQQNAPRRRGKNGRGARCYAVVARRAGKIRRSRRWRSIRCGAPYMRRYARGEIWR